MVNSAKKISLLCILFLSCPFLYAQQKNLKLELTDLVTTHHFPLTYKVANEILFTVLDSSKGIICSVYSPSECIELNGIPSPKVMNVEHTWPQSLGANGISKSDLHHLFITSSQTNSTRSSLPFCDVEKILWMGDQSKRGFNHFNEHCFEVPQSHKGNTARAMFYFAIRYNHEIDDHQESFLRKWHEQDPVDQREIDRNNKISSFQKNFNPFILNPELVQQIENF